MTLTLSPELFAAVSQAIEAQLGLHYPPERWTDLERGLHGAAAELEFDGVEKCARALVLAKLEPAQVDALAMHLTVGETYFFRDPAAFAALASHVIPELVAERRGRARRLRIWSAGCCTGEEPYSLAIALRQALPDFADWQITLLATDLNPRFLHKASAGIYGRWSFRGVSDAMRDRWFRPTPEGRFEILPEIRKMVSFACLNLVEDVYPALANHTNAMDLIFCRNVLMYFSAEQMRKVLGKLRRALVEDGRLAVSATEASREVFAEFVPAGFPGITMYRKAAPIAVAAAMPPAAAPRRAVPAGEQAETPLLSEVAAPVPGKQAGGVRDDHASDARRFADEGYLDAALAACDRALAEDKLVAAHYYLRGVILQEQGALDDAVAACQRALFLDPDFVIAHFALGHLRLRQGRSHEAARGFANARGLLRKYAPEAVLPESDGITAGRLEAIIASMEEALA